MNATEPAHPPAWKLPESYRSLPTTMVMRAASGARALLMDGLGSCGVAKYHYLVLTALATGGSLSQADLSRLTGIDRSDMVATVNDLAERGAITRDVDPGDRRRNLITMTPDGAALLERLEAAVTGAQERLLAGLDAGDRARLVELLGRVLANVEDGAARS
jgi:MarR family transcriptional regulator, lower aerobic nicotinate degradation pathway regulator